MSTAISTTNRFSALDEDESLHSYQTLFEQQQIPVTSSKLNGPPKKSPVTLFPKLGSNVIISASKTSDKPSFVSIAKKSNEQDKETAKTDTKTEPVHKVKTKDMTKSSRSWRIASYISFVVIVGLIVLNIIPRKNRSEVKEILDKSIAVLPFEYMSDEPDKQYLADGTMDAILLHLSKIEDIRVMARTSVEQYRGTTKTTTEICKELNVGFLLEGSFQKAGDQVRLIVQLIKEGTGEHIWANNYDREWKDIFTVQSEVAQLVAKELQVVITPEEKQLIEKIPTTSLIAYDYYQRGKEEFYKYIISSDKREALERAEYRCCC